MGSLKTTVRVSWSEEARILKGIAKRFLSFVTKYMIVSEESILGVLWKLTKEINAGDNYDYSVQVAAKDFKLIER